MNNANDSSLKSAHFHFNPSSKGLSAGSSTLTKSLDPADKPRDEEKCSINLEKGNKKSLAILGGTFDPIHLGHIAISKAIQSTFHFDTLCFLPARIPVHKNASATAAQRVEMIQRALRATPIENAKLCLEEINRQTASYTIVTLKELRAIHPDTSIILILGWDAFLTLPSWHQYEKMIPLCHMLVVNRPIHPGSLAPKLQHLLEAHQTNNPAELKKLTNGKMYLFDAGTHEVSSSALRGRIQRHAPIVNMVPEAVWVYIQEHQLYT